MDQLRAFHRTHHQRGTCRRLSVQAAALWMCTAAASAQTIPGRPTLLGPVSLYPSIALRDIGTDSNVRNESDNAKEDFTFTAQPRLKAVTPFGPALWTASATVGLVYYAVYKDEQSVNRQFESRIAGTRGRLRPFVGATLNQT